MTLKKTKFAVAANTFDQYSETFIWNHALHISPNDTSLIALNPSTNFLPSFDDSDFFKFVPYKRCCPIQFDSLWRLLYSGSVFYPGQKNTTLLANYLKNKGVKIVLAEYGSVGCAVENACKQAGVDLFVHFHGFDASRLIRKWHVQFSYRNLARTAKGFIFPSKFLANKISSIGINQEKFFISPCCVNTVDFPFTGEKDKHLLLSVGRFVDKKAPHKSILAFSNVLKQFPDSRLEMIGDGYLMQKCQNLASSLDIQDKVLFHGEKNHAFVKDLLSKTTIFMQHSVTASDGDTEGLPVAILEAMASGAVVVSTKHSGIPEAVIDGETGFLVEENDVDSMTDRCLTLLNNKEILHKMAIKARKKIETTFTIEKQILSLRKIMAL